MVVDRFDRAPSSLQAIWVLSQRPDEDRYRLAGLSPLTFVELPGRSPMRLKEAYRFDQENGEGVELLSQSLRLLLDEFHPQAIIRLDRDGLQQLFATRGPVQLGDEQTASDRIWHRLNQTADEPLIHLQLQAQLIQALVEHRDVLSAEADLMPAVELLGSHLRSNVPFARLMSLAQRAFPVPVSKLDIVPLAGNPKVITFADGSPAVLLDGK